MKKIITAAIFSLFLLCVSANAATLTVTKTADTNDNVCNADCSLREAISAAAVSGDVVEFASPLFDTAQTVALALGQLQINQAVSINGRGASLTTVSGGNTTRVFLVNSTGNLTLNGVTVTGGSVLAAGSGGGLFNSGTLTINNCVISGNRSELASGGVSAGGGIFNSAGRTLNINDSVISGNTISEVATGHGGGIYNRGTTNITRSIISGNTVSNASSSGVGGGIYTTNNSTLNISDSTLSGNRAESSGSFNFGGAIFSAASTTTTLSNVTVSGNSVSNGQSRGGGIYNNGTLNIVNATVNGNSSPFSNGGITNFGGMQMVNSIVAGNSYDSPTITIDGNKNLFGGDPRLGSLANNGGATPTHALLGDSLAINAGNNCVLTENGCGFGHPALTTDQRGGGFPRLQGATVDIGAVESSRGIVLNANGNGAGSLRQTITDATAGDTIYFDSAFFAVPRTISGNFNSDKNLTIVGPGANLLTLDANDFGRVFTTGNGATVNVSGIRFTRGRAFSPDSAGGILIYQNSTLNATGIIVDNSTAFGGGGGIYVDGTLNLTDSTVENNTANNSAGIFVASTRTATLTRSIVRLNTATGNSGGIGNSGTLNFYNSTLSGNTAPFGGGLSNGGFANFANSTISGNRVNGKGGGIYNGNGTTVHLLNTTVTNNQADGFAAAGIWNENSTPTTVRVRNTIIAGNISGNGNPVDYTGGITNLGNNLINIGNIGLAPLGNYGGSTPTHALLSNSPALNAGDNCVLTQGCGINHASYSNDQRGTNAPRKIGASVDIGAFERNITIDQTTLPNGNLNAVYNQTLTVTRLTSFAGNLGNKNEPDFLAPFTFAVIPIAGQSLPNGLTLSTSGQISGTATTAGSFTFTVKATDADGMAGAAQYTIVIVNTPPTISGSTISRQSGSSVSNSTIATVNDAESGASGVTVTVTSANPSNGVTISNIVNTNGTITADAVAACGATNATFTLTATDGGGATATATLNVTVTANNAPNLVYTASSNVSSGGSLNISPTTATDNGSISTFAIQSVSPALTTPPTINSSGVVSITNANPIGNHTITVRATDNCGLTTDASFTLNVTPPIKTVTKIADTDDGVCDTDCSLREAIAAANSGETVLFASPLFNTAQTITLASELSVTGKTITITGKGANLTAVSGDNLSRVFNVGSGGNLTLDALTITNGRDSSLGGGIYNGGNLTVINCTVSNSSVSGGNDNFGGGIYNASQAISTIRSSTISGNSVSGSGNFANRGGGIANVNGTVLITNSTVSGNSLGGGTNNYGGGIYSEYGPLTVINDTITANTIAISGYNYGGGMATVAAGPDLVNSIVSGNYAPGNPDILGSYTSSNSFIGGDAGLSPLGFYGGTTQTHALLSNSTVINAGNNCVLTANGCGNNNPALSADQRGSQRSIGGTVDIGAFESNITFNQATLPNGNTNANYSQQLSANRQTNFVGEGFLSEATNFAPTTFAIVPVVGQSLPPGITLSSGGLLSGMPTTAGTYNFIVKATDTDGIAGAKQYSIQVLAPTASTVIVSGRVFAPSGRGLANAFVVMTNQNGDSVRTRTTQLGHYRFENVQSGETYIFSVASKRYQFAAQVVNVGEDLDGLNFFAQ